MVRWSDKNNTLFSIFFFRFHNPTFMTAWDECNGKATIQWMVGYKKMIFLIDLVCDWWRLGFLWLLNVFLLDGWMEWLVWCTKLTIWYEVTGSCGLVLTKFFLTILITSSHYLRFFMRKVCESTQNVPQTPTFSTPLFSPY